MGMAASQARFLGLTARKTNVEYQGQQVNQQRASLANESAGLFNQMTALRVPLPPSATNFYSSRYVFQGTDANDFAISAINPSRYNNKGEYEVKLQYKVEEYKGFSNSGLNPSQISATQMTLDGKTYAGSVPAANDLGLIAVMKNMNENRSDSDQVDATMFTQYTCSDTGKIYYALTDDIANYDPSDTKSKIELHFANLQTVGKTATASATFETDTSNTERYSKITISNVEPESAAAALGIDTEAGDISKTYSLDIKQVQDDLGYEEATKQYEFQKMLYERSIQDINARTESIQQQDKSLELKLKQLDTEQKALQTEMEAVQKVIQKNVETTFKTFG